MTKDGTLYSQYTKDLVFHYLIKKCEIEYAEEVDGYS